MSRLFIIGDVHGMRDELARLVVKLNVESGDRFAFLGDYVDKGPESIATLRFVRALVEQYPGSVAICGNHEDSAMRLYAKAQKQGSWDGLRKAEKEPWLKTMTQSDYDWMRSLPLVARPVDGIVLVHGGMFPAFFDKHGSIGDVPVDWHKGGGKKMDRMRRFLRVRHVYKPGSFSKSGKPVDGNMVSLGDESESTTNWTERYNGREGFAFYGHAPQKSEKPLLSPYTLGLDTGAVFGGRLTAAVLHDKGFLTPSLLSIAGRDTTFVSVEAEAKHAEWLEDSEA